MVDWGEVTMVAVSGIVSVFAVLIILNIAVSITGSVLDSITKKQSEKQSG
ncbi:hypothetical protein SPSYN_01007 [Sporotomaculum syntrophicum]|uniref:Oxaloacetate decarboxylase, gamma chain n=1 Tax=Sporotomaculum syntrophicum TaxID=182264 RepID=A0A9D3AZV6_9FIRM|nr:hypothetical protein [Sporotomaculum syntrophicum]KAF1086263.1 hypothetical protein SPSYN_01007 [Sporotomaculum syntrophicum]